MGFPSKNRLEAEPGRQKPVSAAGPISRDLVGYRPGLIIAILGSTARRGQFTVPVLQAGVRAEPAQASRQPV